jgi:thiol-disulfide isomerase/thioredoxin
MSSSGTTSPRSARHRRRDSDWTPVALIVSGALAVLLIVAGVLALVGVFTPSSPKEANGSLVGTVIHGFSLPGVNEPGSVLAPWSDGRATVVLFVGDFCAPCHEELDRLAPLIGHGDIGGVRFVGVDEDELMSTARSFLRATHVDFPVGLDHFLELADVLVPGGLPAAVFVAGTGRVVDVQYGLLSNEQLSAGLSELRRD